MTKKFAVLGSPISHSLSPQIHAAAFAVQGLKHSYERFEVSELAPFIAEKDDFAGFSLTMPLKEQALQLADRVSDSASETGGVNTLLRTDSGWSGFNTDVDGIRGAIAKCDFHSVSVLGTGATARSSLAALRVNGALIWGRNQQRQLELAERFDARASSLEEALNADLVISTLTAGALWELLTDSYPGTLLDVVYAKQSQDPATRFTKSISGVEMLLHQALFQQRIFANGDPELPLPEEESVFAAMRRALGMEE